MTKKGCFWFNILIGAICGIVTGVIFMFLWMAFPLMPAMLYMTVLEQMKVFHTISGAYSTSDDMIIGIFHYSTAIVLGILFAMIFRRIISGIWSGLGLGAVFGIIWWILTPFYLMPFFFTVSPGMGWSKLDMGELLNSLGSHIFYGVLLGIFYSLSKKIITQVNHHDKS